MKLGILCPPVFCFLIQASFFGTIRLHKVLPNTVISYELGEEHAYILNCQKLSSLCWWWVSVRSFLCKHGFSLIIFYFYLQIQYNGGNTLDLTAFLLTVTLEKTKKLKSPRKGQILLGKTCKHFRAEKNLTASEDQP